MKIMKEKEQYNIKMVLLDTGEENIRADICFKVDGVWEKPYSIDTGISVDGTPEKIVEELMELLMYRAMVQYGEEQIPYFTDELGSAVWDAANEPDNSTYDMAKAIKQVLYGCETARDFRIADGMLTAITGYSLESLIRRTEQEGGEN